MAIHWQSNRQHKISSLTLSGEYKHRLAAPHVLGLAKSIVEVGNINHPAIHVPSKVVAAGEDRVAAHQLAQCWKKLPALEGEVRWTKAVADALAGRGADATLELRAFTGDDHDVATVRAHENAHRRHDDRDRWLASLARPRGEDAEGGAVEPGEPGEAEPPGNPGGEAAPPSELDPPDNVAQGFDEPPPVCHASAQDGPRAGYPACGRGLKSGDSTTGPRGNPAGISCAWPDCQALRSQWCDEERNKLLRSESPKEKGARYKAAAEQATAATGKPVSPAAVKQAAYRERKKEGKVKPATRQKHDDSGEPLGEAALVVERGLIEVDAHLQSAVVRLRNLAERHPELRDRFPVDGWLAAIKDVAKAVRAAEPEAPCVFCLAEVKRDPKAPCQACRGQRWLTKKELAEAPAELRKAAGL